MVNAFEVNEERIEKLKFDANGLIPAVAQDVKSGDVVMLAYMNKESLTETIKTGYATYFSSFGKRAKRRVMYSVCGRYSTIVTATRCF